MKTLTINSRSDLRDKLIYSINTANLELLLDTILYDNEHDSFINNDLIQSICIVCINRVPIIFYDLMKLLNYLGLLNIDNMDIIERYVGDQVDGEISWNKVLIILSTDEVDIYVPKITLYTNINVMWTTFVKYLYQLKKKILLE